MASQHLSPVSSNQELLCEQFARHTARLLQQQLLIRKQNAQKKLSGLTQKHRNKQGNQQTGVDSYEMSLEKMELLATQQDLNRLGALLNLPVSQWSSVDFQFLVAMQDLTS